MASLLAVILLAATPAASLAAAPVPATTPAAAPTAASSAASSTDLSDTTSAATISGFRSAQFGMTEADVRAAIVKDFGVKPDAIIAGQNPAERTKLLSLAVPDLLQGGGTAQVSYVLGYKSKTLIQVGVSWSKATDPSITESELYADGDVLRTHFVAAGYQPDTVKTGLVLPNGILLFRGEDAAGHATILILEGTFKPAAEGSQQQTLTPTSLALLYAADPGHPDVFKLAPGQF